MEMRLPNVWIRASVIAALTGVSMGWNPGPLVAQESSACQEVRHGAGAPAITALVDTLALNSDPPERPVLGTGSPDSAFVAMSFDGDGAPVHAVISHPTATFAQTAPIREWLRRHGVPSGEPGSLTWGVMRWEDGVTLRPLQVLTHCAPMLRREERERLTRTLSARPQTLGVRVVLRMLVGGDGSVRQVEIAESSGSVPADEAFQDVVRLVQFEPASINGDPVPIWIQLPLQSVVRRRR
jgi:TonB family protein